MSAAGGMDLDATAGGELETPYIIKAHMENGELKFAMTPRPVPPPGDKKADKKPDEKPEAEARKK